MTIGQRFPTFHERLTDEGYEPKQLLHFSDIKESFPKLRSLSLLECGLVDMVIIPIELVPESKERFLGLDPEECYVIYQKPR